MAAEETQPLSEIEPVSPSKTLLRKKLPPLRGLALAFLNAQPVPAAEKVPRQPPPFRKAFFFFYGSLMDPATLGKVLNLSERPILQPAKVIGYHYKLWGPYPALLDGPCGAEVHGAAFEIESAEQVKLLQDYETEHYRKAACRIRLEDGSRIIGYTFVWNSNVEDLHEGCFDLKEFQMGQTGSVA